MMFDDDENAVSRAYEQGLKAGRREGLEEAATIAKNSAWTDDSCGEYESGWDAGCNQVAMNIRSRMEEADD